MKNNFTILLLILFYLSQLEAQTIVWSSDCEDLTGFTSYNSDGDIYNGWQNGLDAILWGFEPGYLIYSQSASGYSDHILTTPVFNIPDDALGIEFNLRVASFDAIYFSEHFTIYIIDSDDNNINALIHDEILTEGGHGTAKIITAEIPNTFAGRNCFIFLRHFDSLDGTMLMVDDFEVTFSETLNTDNIVKTEIVKLYPNPSNGIVSLITDKSINSIKVINQLGQVVSNIPSKRIVNNQIDISHLNSGIYYLNLNIDNQIYSERIIKN